MSAIQSMLLISVSLAAGCVSLIVMLFAEHELQYETIFVVLLVYFVIAFFGYMRAYAKELREKREPYVP